MIPRRLSFQQWASSNQDLAEELKCKKEGFGGFGADCGCRSICNLRAEYDRILAKEDAALAAEDGPQEQE